MRFGLTTTALIVALALLWTTSSGDARQVTQGLSNLPTEVRPARQAAHVVAFGSYPPMSVELLRVDPNGRWVEVMFAPDERAAHELPAKAWIHIQQITLIAPDGPRSSR